MYSMGGRSLLVAAHALPRLVVLRLQALAQGAEVVRGPQQVVKGVDRHRDSVDSLLGIVAQRVSLAAIFPELDDGEGRGVCVTVITCSSY